MARTIRFHLDEHVGHAVAAGLRRLGIDVTTTNDAGLSGATDPGQLAYANAEGRVIFTEDGDFLVLHHLGLEHPGIAYCQQNTRTVGQIISGLQHHLGVVRAGRRCGTTSSSCETRHQYICVAGLMTSSGTWTDGGRLQTYRIASATSSGFRMLARWAALTGVGRSFRIGVSISPG